MRVLLIAPDSEFVRQLRDAFSAEGHELAYVNERALRAWPLLWRAIGRIPPLKRLSNALLARRIIRRATQFNPRLALVAKGTTVGESVLRALHARGIVTANWFPENGRREPYRSWLDRHIGFYDLFFCFDSGLLEQQSEFPATRIVYLPLAVDPAAYAAGSVTDDDHAYDADVCFVGAWYPERERLLASLAEFDMKIFGWKDWERSTLASRYGGSLDAVQSAKAYRCAKVVLNMNTQPPVRGVNAKTFEICAAGGFQLTDVREDLPGLFRPGEEVATFQHPDEVAGLVRRYLADPALRSQIAQAGRARVLHEHTFRHRVRTIMANIS